MPEAIRVGNGEHRTISPLPRTLRFASPPSLTQCPRVLNSSHGPSASLLLRYVTRLLLLPVVSEKNNCESSLVHMDGCLDGRSSQYVLLSAQDPSQAESGFTDGSDVLFSLYNEKAAEYDQKLVENWREDAQGIMLLVRSAVPSPLPSVLMLTLDIARVVSYQPRWQDSFHNRT